MGKIYDILKEWYDTLKLTERMKTIAKKFEEWTGIEPEHIELSGGSVLARATLHIDGNLSGREIELLETIARAYDEVHSVLSVTFLVKETQRPDHNWIIDIYRPPPATEPEPNFRTIRRFKREGGYYYAVIIEYTGFDTDTDC